MVLKGLFARSPLARKQLWLFISALVVFHLFSSAAVAQYSRSRPVGQAGFYDKAFALKGLEGVHIVFDILEGSAEKNEVQLDPLLKEKAQKLLEGVGLKLLTEEEMEATPGNPKMDIFPSFPKNMVRVKGKLRPKRPWCCTMGFWMSFTEGAVIPRQPDKSYVMSPWGGGGNTNDCRNIGEWMSKNILEKIEEFVSVYEEANSQAPKKIKESVAAEDTTPKTLSCDDIYVLQSDELFVHLSHRFKQDHLPELDPIIEGIKACGTQKFIIESHVNNAVPTHLQLKLSQQRAEELEFYLVAQGVSHELFEARGKGAKEPLELEDTPEGLAKNQRIQVLPANKVLASAAE